MIIKSAPSSILDALYTLSPTRKQRALWIFAKAYKILSENKKEYYKTVKVKHL